jgi:uncharacterized low-complexity protein
MNRFSFLIDVLSSSTIELSSPASCSEISPYPRMYLGLKFFDCNFNKREGSVQGSGYGYRQQAHLRVHLLAPALALCACMKCDLQLRSAAANAPSTSFQTNNANDTNKGRCGTAKPGSSKSALGSSAFGRGSTSARSHADGLCCLYQRA